jgi:hypothetical protein
MRSEMTKIDDAIFRDLDRRRRQARPRRGALASGLVAQAMASASGASRDVPTSWDPWRTASAPGSVGSDAVRATARVF